MAMDSVWNALTGTQDWSVAGNWTGGVPANAEKALVSAGSADITGGMDQSAIDLTLLSIGSDFKGSIGTAASPLTLGATTEIQVRAPQSKTLFIRAAESHTITKLVVNGTSQFPNACAILSGGAGGTLGIWSKVHVVSGLLYVLGSAKVTDLYVGPAGVVHIEEGATITNIHNYDGQVYNSAAVATKVYQNGGKFTHQGTTTGNVNVGTFEVHDGTLKINSLGGTFTLVDMRGGVLEGTETDYENTVTDMNVYYAATARMNQATIHTNAPKVYGSGKYSGPGTPSIEVPDVPIP